MRLACAQKRAQHPFMPMPPRTLAEINQANAEFWREQQELLTTRMGDEPTRESAFKALEAEQLRGVPLKSRMTLELALQEAELTGQNFLSAQGRKGGAASKTDALQRLIEETVKRQPNISVEELKTKLHALQGISAIEDIADGVIGFADRRGHSKEAPWSGLKDRLSRAKKKIRSR